MIPAAQNPLRFRVLPGAFALCRLPPEAAVPDWADRPPFSSVTRTPDELSIACLAEVVPADSRAERGWALIQLLGPFPFSAVGICAEISSRLAAAGISLIALATFDTDYFLVPQIELSRALEALTAAGHQHVQ